ncbi:hypothetical protein SLEP1_g34579 [Rubroshorea leprosula]|uniref:Uncharacterized protein n=1 Tax=Rubroshorea leprosula TaxID=152421 RepID=A0AAV5KKF3_9ROSI|nr:hypothetical protein SLEP1_g34579 [Rubroshorea leprosula]
MSSEETISVVESEVMPLEYGGMDSESSPSSSERTVKGVGGGEVVGGGDVVGVGGDSVPITMVEVEGRRERCYDVDADIVEEVKQYKSELRTRDSLGLARSLLYSPTPASSRCSISLSFFIKPCTFRSRLSSVLQHPTVGEAQVVQPLQPLPAIQIQPILSLPPLSSNPAPS